MKGEQDVSNKPAWARSSSETDQAIVALKGRIATILEQLSVAVHADVITFFLYDAATDEFDLPVGIGIWDEDTFSDPRMCPRSDRVAGRIVRQGCPILANQVEGHETMEGPFAHRERILSAGGFPVQSQAGEPLGVLFASYRRNYVLSEDDQQVIWNATREIASAVLRTNLFPELRRLRSRQVSEEDQTMKVIVSLACNVLRMPVAIWILDYKNQSLRIRESTALTRDYLDLASARVGDGSIISQVVETGLTQSIFDLSTDGRFRYQDQANKADWKSSITYPIYLRGKIIGAIEVFSFDQREFELDEIETLRLLANLTSDAIENAQRSREAKQLAYVAQTLSASPDINRGMQVIVDSAIDLTGAESSTIFLLDQRTNTFIVGARSPHSPTPPESLPRQTGGISRKIIDTGETIIIDDTYEYEDIREDVLRQGTRSMVGVRLQMAREQIGVLYVNGKRKDQFGEHEATLLQTLANQVSLALGWSRLLLKPSEAIEQAISHLFGLELILKDLCNTIQVSLGYEFVALQLIRSEERIVETVYGTGIAARWSGLARHYLEPDTSLRDIQASIAKTGQVEIISGWDDRFDRWIYDEYSHDQLSRVFLPIVFFRDERGQVMEVWYENFRLEVLADDSSQGRQHKVITIIPPSSGKSKRQPVMEIVGTLEAGFQDTRKSISLEQAKQLVRLVGERALEIRKSLLPYVLETIVEHARQIVGADSASLHFLYEPKVHRYTYEVSAGDVGQQFLHQHPPRKGGLGWQAIHEKMPKFIPDPSQGHPDLALEKLNPEVYREGIRSIAAFPLLMEEKQGVLYVHFHEAHRFTENEIGWVQLLVNQAIDAIRHATVYLKIRDRARQLSTLHSVASSLTSSPEELDLLRHIAWNTLNMLAADVVTIYEYIESEKRFLTPPDLAGRLRAERAMTTEIFENDAPALLVKHGQNAYAERSAMNHTLNNPSRRRLSGKSSFVERERIRSSAGILLKVGDETVGVMFINYRRPHYFEEEEKQYIETLASSAAIAIKNRRLLETLSAVDREIITTLDLEQLLALIVKQALKITHGDFADIRLVEPFSHELVMLSRYPQDVKVDPSWTRVPVGKGVTGIVAQRRQSVLINDVNSDPHYKAYFPNVNSELAVPLMGGEGQVLGVLNIESHRTGAFTKNHLRTLEALANQAVICIQNAERQKRLVANETIATLGDLTGPLVHRMNGDVSAIRVLAKDLLSSFEGEGEAQEKLEKIYLVSERVLDEAQNLKRWVIESSPTVDPRQAVYAALDRVPLSSDIVTRVQLSPDLRPVSAGHHQLVEIFAELVKNAVEALPAGGVISISGEGVTWEGKSWIIFFVEDNGTGIREEDLERIFDRKFSTKVHKGLGFGLWWTRSYLERVGGRITVESQLGKGSRFTIVLPCSEASQPASEFESEINE